MKIRTVTWIIVISLLKLGCSPSEPSQPDTAQQLIDKGWVQYSAANYQGAHDFFNQSMTLDANIADAYNGSGWSGAKLNDLDGAVSDFNTGLLLDTANTEIRAGLAFVYNAKKSYILSDSLALQVLGRDSSWVFSRSTGISAADLHLLLAENYFAEGMYELSRDQVHILTPAFPSNYDVTTVDGRTGLAVEIERLRAII